MPKDTLTQYVSRGEFYAALGILVALHFLDPIFHFGVLQFP